MEEKKKEEIKKFISNPQNIGNCKKCPYNEGFKSSDFEDKKPCGQYNCWVRITTK